LIAAAGLALEAPDLRGIPPIGPAWDRVETVQAFTTACVNALQRRAIVAKYSSKLIAEAWDADVLQARADLMADGGSWWRRLLSGRYKAARRKVQGLCTVPAPSRMEELVVLTDRILEAKRLRASVAETASAVQTLAGIRAGGADAPWEELQKIRDWALKFRALLAARKLPASLGDWVVGAWDRAVLGGLRSAAEKSAAAWRAVAAQVRSALALPTGGAKDPEALAFAAAEERAEAWRQNLPKLPSYVAYWRLHQAVSRRSLGELTAIAHEGRAEPAHLALILELLMGLAFVGRNAEHDRARLLQILPQIAEAAGLLRSTGRIILRIEVDDYIPAFERGKRHRLAVLVVQRELGCLLAFFDADHRMLQSVRGIVEFVAILSDGTCIGRGGPT
jgi:hypothetical protein